MSSVIAGAFFVPIICCLSSFSDENKIAFFRVFFYCFFLRKVI